MPIDAQILSAESLSPLAQKVVQAMEDTSPAQPLVADDEPAPVVKRGRGRPRKDVPGVVPTDAAEAKRVRDREAQRQSRARRRAREAAGVPPPPARKPRAPRVGPAAGDPRDSSHAAPHAPPFDGGPPFGGTAETAEPSILQAADPKELATILVVALDGAVTALAKYRYGDRRMPDGTLLAESMSASNEAKASITKAATAWLKAAAVALTPGQALAVAVASAYVPSAMMAEMARAAIDKRPSTVQ